MGVLPRATSIQIVCIPKYQYVNSKMVECGNDKFWNYSYSEYY